MGERVRPKDPSHAKGDPWMIEHRAIPGDFFHGDFMGQRIVEQGTEISYVLRNLRTGDRQWVLGFELERA